MRQSVPVPVVPPKGLPTDLGAAGPHAAHASNGMLQTGRQFMNAT
jgi:hypothetical protein